MANSGTESGLGGVAVAFSFNPVKSSVVLSKETKGDDFSTAGTYRSTSFTSSGVNEMFRMVKGGVAMIVFTWSKGIQQ